MYFSSDQLYGTGTVWNVSIGGWRVDSDMAVDPGTALTLYIMLHSYLDATQSDFALRISGCRIHRAGSEGVG